MNGKPDKITNIHRITENGKQCTKDVNVKQR